MPPSFQISGLSSPWYQVSVTGGHVAAGAVLVGRRVIDAGAISGCGGGPLASIGQRGLELQGPERQVVPVAAEVAHRAVAEIPPAIPLRPGEVDVVERPGRGGAEPEVPVEPGRDRVATSVGRSVTETSMSLFRFAASSDCQPQARDTQTWTSRTGPIAPAWISSTTRR